MNDETLIEQYRQSKDRELLEELLRRNFDRIHRFVASMVRDRHAADDLVQDVFLNIVRNLDGFHGDSRFSTWTYRIALNRVYRHFETNSRKPVVYDSESLENEPGKDTSQLVTINELNEMIGEAVGTLSPALRSAILLTCVEGLSPEEAAKVEGCTAANIHWRVHKARKILKLKLADYLEPDDERR